MKKHSFLLILLSLLFGILAALPLMFDCIPYLSFLLFIPYFYMLLACFKERQLRFFYLSGLFFFWGYYFGAFSFFASMYPLDFAGLNSLESLAVLFAAMLLLPLFQAWFSAFSVLLLGFLQKKRFLRFPVAFALSAAALFTLFAFAQNFTWAGVPWANTAVGIAGAPLLIQGASLLGSTFLIFFIVFCNAALAEAVDAFRACQDRKAVLAFFTALLLFVSQLALGGIRLLKEPQSEKALTVAMIQGSSPSTEPTLLLAHLRTCRYQAQLAAKEKDIDVMLWSESVVTYALQSDEDLQAFFAEIAEETGAIQLVGAFSSEKTPSGEDGYYNALFLFYPDGTVSEQTYKKRRPVPFGEYVPMPALFERIIPSLTEISMLSRDTTAGEDSSLFETPIGIFGGLICFDSIYPALASESVRDGAELLFLSTDDSWFDGSFAKSLHFRHANLRAVENGRYVVRTGNTGICGVINANGETVYTIPPDRSYHGIADVALTESTTLYTKTGELFPVLCAAFLVLLPIITCLYDARDKKNKQEAL